MYKLLIILFLAIKVNAKYYSLETNASAKLYIDEYYTQYSLQNEFTSIVYFVNICDYNTHLSIDDFKNFWYSNTFSFKELITKCSYEQFIFKDENNLVISLNVPCNNLNINNFNSDNYVDLLFKLYNNTLNQVVKNLNINLLNYKYHIINLPQELSSKINWDGLATIGCGSLCPSWYNGISLKNFNVKELASLYLHEIGHNLNLEHSNSLEREYGDTTCAMGNSYNYQCFNAPNSYKLQWNNPSNIINYGINTFIEIKSRTLLKDNFIIIKKNNLEYYIDYRTSSIIDNISNSINFYILNNQETIIIGRIFRENKSIFYDNIAITTLNYTNNSVFLNICYENKFNKCDYQLESSIDSTIPHKELLYGFIGAVFLIFAIII